MLALRLLAPMHWSSCFDSLTSFESLIFLVHTLAVCLFSPWLVLTLSVGLGNAFMDEGIRVLCEELATNTCVRFLNCGSMTHDLLFSVYEYPRICCLMLTVSVDLCSSFGSERGDRRGKLPHSCDASDK